MAKIVIFKGSFTLERKRKEKKTPERSRHGECRYKSARLDLPPFPSGGLSGAVGRQMLDSNSSST